jgi:hypothetical protein
MNYKGFSLYVELCGKHLKQATRKQCEITQDNCGTNTFIWVRELDYRKETKKTAVVKVLR